MNDSIRGRPPLWRHDAYTLRRLARGLELDLGSLAHAGLLGHGRTLVDLGCGCSPYRPLVEHSGSAYVGCDLDAGPGVDQIISSDCKTTLPSGSADVVGSFQVLEHVWSLDDYLGECRRLLQPQGRLLLSTHGTWLYHPHPTDFRRWTRDGLAKELESRGFEVTSMRALVGPLAWTTQFRTLAYWHLADRLGIPGRILGAALCLFMYARMRLEDAITPSAVAANNAAVYLLTARLRDN